MPSKPRKQSVPHLVGSKWTATQNIFGWRHFQVLNRKQHSGSKLIFAEMVAACDPRVRFWLNAQILRDRSTWLPGWQPLNQHR